MSLPARRKGKITHAPVPPHCEPVWCYHQLDSKGYISSSSLEDVSILVNDADKRCVCVFLLLPCGGTIPRHACVAQGAIPDAVVVELVYVSEAGVLHVLNVEVVVVQCPLAATRK